MGKGGMIGILNEVSCHTPSDLGLWTPFMNKKKKKKIQMGLEFD